jgi:hypothetical protein
LLRFDNERDYPSPPSTTLMQPNPQPPFACSLLDTVVALAQTIEPRDQATGSHSFRATISAVLLGLFSAPLFGMQGQVATTCGG